MNRKIIIPLLTGMLILFFVGNIFLYTSNNAYRQRYRLQLLRNDSLLSVNQLLRQGEQADRQTGKKVSGKNAVVE